MSQSAPSHWRCARRISDMTQEPKAFVLWDKKATFFDVSSISHTFKGDYEWENNFFNWFCTLGGFSMIWEEYWEPFLSSSLPQFLPWRIFFPFHVRHSTLTFSVFLKESLGEQRTSRVETSKTTPLKLSLSLVAYLKLPFSADFCWHLIQLKDITTYRSKALF